MKTMNIILSHPISTEKSIRLLEAENKIVFVVKRKATKHDIKDEVEKVFKAKVIKVNTLIDKKGNKRAYVKFGPETEAIDIATKLGLM